MAATPSTFDISRLNQATVNLESYLGDAAGPELSAADLLLIFNNLKTNTVLTDLTLDYQRIGQHGMASNIAEVLQSNSTLTSLSLVNTGLDVAAVKLIAEALKRNTTLKRLEIGANGLDNEAAAAIAEALKLNGTLKTLDLSENRIANEGAIAIAMALKINRTLKELSLEDNIIDKLGADSISEALDSNDALISLSMDDNRAGVDEALLEEFKRKCRVNLEAPDRRWGALDREPPARASRGEATLLCVLASRRDFERMTLRAAPTEAGAACGGGGGGSGAEVDPRISGTTRPFQASSVDAVAEGVAADKADGPTPD